MYENGGIDHQADQSDARTGNPWLRLALVLGVIVALVLLIVWGASAAPSGGCGGG
jgi:hypothetical protein